MDLYVAAASGGKSRELANKVCRLADRQKIAVQIVQVVDVDALRQNKRFEELASTSCLRAPQM